jgi:hypothetical protein
MIIYEMTTRALLIGFPFLIILALRTTLLTAVALIATLARDSGRRTAALAVLKILTRNGRPESQVDGGQHDG